MTEDIHIILAHVTETVREWTAALAQAADVLLSPCAMHFLTLQVCK